MTLNSRDRSLAVTVALAGVAAFDASGATAQPMPTPYNWGGFYGGIGGDVGFSGDRFHSSFFKGTAGDTFGGLTGTIGYNRPITESWLVGIDVTGSLNTGRTVDLVSGGMIGVNNYWGVNLEGKIAYTGLPMLATNTIAPYIDGGWGWRDIGLGSATTLDKYSISGGVFGGGVMVAVSPRVFLDFRVTEFWASQSFTEFGIPVCYHETTGSAELDFKLGKR
jgi:hypothetical protein